ISLQISINVKKQENQNHDHDVNSTPQPSPNPQNVSRSNRASQHRLPGPSSVPAFGEAVFRPSNPNPQAKKRRYRKYCCKLLVLLEFNAHNLGFVTRRAENQKPA
ncbi:hypothetical protein, partial [Paracoccus sp. Ld10]|uniref:hypothetical protein n=1 Tax=Paracoccus sp. Ld10 TaxID=649158 RepID=UPI00386AA264